MKRLRLSMIGNESLPSLWWAGALTVGLVWFTGVNSIPDGLAWIDDRLIVHISAASFLLLGLLLGFQRSRLAKIAVLLLQALCAAAFIAVTPHSAPILNIVLVAQLPFVLGVRPAIVIAAGINLAHLTILMVFHDRTAFEAFMSMALLACFQLFSLLIGHFAIQATEARSALTATNAELLATRSLLESSARDRERLRVSRELHDTAGHTLTALKLNLRELRDRSRPEDREALNECLILSADLLEDIRDLVGNLRAQDPLDLKQALIELTRPFSEPEFVVEVADDVAVEDLAIAENLLAVARESITNVVRHAEARRCTISVFRDGGRVVLTVVDDGIGAGGVEGFGIRGMRERMKSARGELVITANAPTGTRVSAAWGGA